MQPDASHIKWHSVKEWSRRLCVIKVSFCSQLETYLYLTVYPSFIHSGYFTSASSSPLLLRGVPDYITHTVSCLTRRRATGNCEWRIFPKVPTRRLEWDFEHATCRMQGTKFTTEPQSPKSSSGCLSPVACRGGARGCDCPRHPRGRGIQRGSFLKKL